MKRSNFAKTVLATCLLGVAAAIAAATSNDCTAPQPTSGSPQYQTETAQAADGVCLRSFAWLPEKGALRGVVVVTHGVRDHALRYEFFATKLSEQGFAVYAQDLRGHAHSGGDRQRFDSMAQLVADTDIVVSRAMQRHPGLPMFVLGHSLGGLVTAAYAESHADKVRGLVLSGAALQPPRSVSSFEIGVARLVGSIAPGLPLQQVADSEFSRDKAVMAKLRSDPLVVRDKLPAASVVAAVNGMDEVRKNVDRLKMPLLILHGTGDKVNPIEGSQALSQTAPSTDKTLKTYPGLYHDLLHEPEYADVERDITAWLSAKTAPK
jgi:acylglycerol lipase